MASHFVALNRGVEGELYSDFITGVAATANVVELRLDDASAFTRVDIQKALDAFERFFQNPQQWATAGFVVNG
jgi:hypothetical protein